MPSATDSPANSSPRDMPRHVRIGLLLDLYGNLLTDRQREFVRLHYDEDQSFGEIAQGKGVSRQAVHDAVKHAEKSLEQYERKLRLLERGIPRILEKIEQSPLPKDGEETVDEPALAASDEWMIETLEQSAAAPGGMDGDSRVLSQAAVPPSADSNSLGVLEKISEGLDEVRKRILRSGGIIYDADGLLNDVNRLLAWITETVERRKSGRGGAQDV